MTPLQPFAGVTVLCPFCRRPMPTTGNRVRPIPGMGGKRRAVHPLCADEIDRQGRLEVEGPGKRWRRSA
jgi:hypothetical protein